MSEVNVTYLTWDEVPEEIKEEYCERILAKTWHPCDRMNEFKVYALAQELWEDENGR